MIYALPNFLRVFLLDENLSRNIHATFKFLYICYESLGNLKFTSWASNIGKTEWARLNFRQIFHQNLSFLKDTYFQKKVLFTIEFINPFQPSVVFHIEASHLHCRAKQMTGFYMRCNIRLKWVQDFRTWNKNFAR